MPAFAEYIQITKQQLKTERTTHGLPCDDNVIDMNAPFELFPLKSRFHENKEKNYQHGVLLIHGFLDSPYTLHSVAKVYQKQGFLVRCILLPGHGSTPQALQRIKIKHWQKTIDHGIKTLQDDCQKIHLCGFSLGGALCYLALKKHPIASLCLLAPAFEISNITAITLPFVTKVSQKKWFSKLQWVVIKGQPYNHVRYNAFPLQTAEYVNQIIKKTQKRLKRYPINCPLFTAITLEDKTVRFRSIYKAFKTATNLHKRAICFTRKKFVFKRSDIKFITMKNSHIGLAVSPDDQYLGRTAAKNATVQDLHYHRLTYNPRFDALNKSLSEFLNQLTHHA